MKWLNTIITHNLLGLPWKPTKNKECFGLPPMIPMQHSNIKSFCWKTKGMAEFFPFRDPVFLKQKKNKNKPPLPENIHKQALETYL